MRSFHQLVTLRRSRHVFPALLVLGALAACGPHYHLNEYDFSNHSVALVYLAPATPSLRTGGYDVAGAGNVATAVLRTGGDVAKEVAGRRARDSTARSPAWTSPRSSRDARSIARAATSARVR